MQRQTSSPSMSIFISHSKHDEDFAIDVSKELASSNITAYLDVFDTRLYLKRGKTEIVHSLQEEIHKCNYLLVILSSATQESWWVPFEIGIAWETNKAIINCINYHHNNKINKFPEFLLQWPTIKNARGLSKAIQRIKRENKDIIVASESYDSPHYIFNARRFENELYDDLIN